MKTLIAERRVIRRREPRIQHLAELHMTYEGEDCEVSVRPPDVSPHGIFVNTSTHFPEGTVIKLRFRLTHSNVEVQTRGEVRYCLPGVGIGVEFVGIEPEAVQAIEAEMNALSRPRNSRNQRHASRGK